MCTNLETMSSFSSLCLLIHHSDTGDIEVHVYLFICSIFYTGVLLYYLYLISGAIWYLYTINKYWIGITKWQKTHTLLFLGGARVDRSYYVRLVYHILKGLNIWAKNNCSNRPDTFHVFGGCWVNFRIISIWIFNASSFLN